MTSLPVLGWRSWFSLGRGLWSPRDLLGRARALGITVLGVADWNNLYGWPELARAARREGLRLIPGLRIAPGDRPLGWAWATDRRGWARLMDLATRLLAGVPDPWDDWARKPWPGLQLSLEDPALLARLARLARPFEEPSAGDALPRLTRAAVYGRPWARELDEAAAAGVPGGLIHNEGLGDPEGDAAAWALIRAVQACTTVDALGPGEALAKLNRPQGPAELERHFSPRPDLLAATRALGEALEPGLGSTGRFIFPGFNGFDEAQAQARLQELCTQGRARRYPRGVPEGFEARLNLELDLIRRKGFTSYFLTVHDIVSQCPRTCGRGSAAASLVSYLLGLTHVDPLRWNLFFERFLNEGRTDPPDIDIDFPWDEREAVLRYVFTRWAGRAALVADHVTFSDRAPWREAAKALGYPEREVTRFMDLRRRGELEALPAEVRAGAAILKGRPRYLGSHPGGVVLSPGPLTDWVHVQTSPLGRPVIAWEKDGAEEMGLVKIDLLGNRSLAVVRDALALTAGRRAAGGPGGPDLSWETFQPYDEPETLARVREGDTLGVFYIESPATRLLLKKMGRADYPHLVAASSIIRPAANRWINTYVARLRGETWRGLDPEGDEVLADTYGVMVYQEDVSRIAMAVCGFDAAEADRIRKILSKKDRESDLEAVRERWFAGGRARGRSDAVLEAYWEMVLSFQGYSFCKPHSASYALVSLKSAWMRRWYPLEFHAAVINNGGGFYTRQVYLNSLRRAGFELRGVDVNASEWLSLPEAGGLGASPGALRLGLSFLAEVSEGVLRALLDERHSHGAFRDYEDFLARLQPRLADLRPLIRSGALDSLLGPLSRPQAFWLHHQVLKAGLFWGLPAPPDFLTPPGEAQCLADEKQFTGVLIRRFPLDLFQTRAQRLAAALHLPPLVKARQLAALPGRRIAAAGLFVTQKTVGTVHKELMSFVSFEDETGLFEAVLFPEVWERVHTLLWSGMAFLFTGRVQIDWGAVTLELEELYSLNAPDQARGGSRVSRSAKAAAKSS